MDAFAASAVLAAAAAAAAAAAIMESLEQQLGFRPGVEPCTCTTKVL